jgi:hypothetical protein
MAMFGAGVRIGCAALTAADACAVLCHGAQGTLTSLRRRLSEHHRQQAVAAGARPARAAPAPFIARYDAYVVVDFEATCLEGRRDDYPHEIIEFPAILLRATDLDEVSAGRAPPRSRATAAAGSGCV